MAKQPTTQAKKHTLPRWAGWLIGYAAALAAAAGLVYFWRVAFRLPPSFGALAPTLVAMGVASLLVLAVWLLQRFAREDMCLRGAALVFCCGALFCFATAPLQAPDENKHFLRANAVSRGHFTYDYNEVWPDDVALLMQHFAPKQAHDVQYAGRQMTPAAIEEYWLALETGEAATEKVDAPVMFMLLPFLHQGAFMAVARLLGFSALGQMYAGRLANLILYTVLCYFALRNAQRYRTVLLAAMLLPISLFMAASCSYDCLMLAACYLMVSFFCKAEFTAKDLAVFMAALALATYTKLNNVVLVGILLLMPKSRWKVKWKPWQVVLATAGVALVFWWVVGALDGGVLKTGWPEGGLARGSGVASGPAEQLGMIARNPFAFVAHLLLSIYEDNAYLFDLGRFGWMDLVVPLVGGLSVLTLCLGTVLGTAEKTDDKRGAVAGLCLMGLLYGGAVLAGMYVLDTDVGSIRVTGQQPRYFLPAFLLLFLAGCVALSGVLRPRLDTKTAALKRENAVLWTCAAVAVLAAVLVFQNYYVGRWLTDSDGQWWLINLFGRQVT